MAYFPINHYWIVAGSTTQVYSSANAGYRPITNPAYVAWLAFGNKPTPIASENELWDVLAAQFPGGLPAGDSNAQDRKKVILIDKFGDDILTVLYEVDKRLRVLEAKPTITLAQFKTGLKALLS